MTAYEMLAQPVRKFIRDKKWEALRPIQEAAIIKILGTDNHYILVSPTASGKTEAAFLPVLSAIDFSEPGIPVLYISPLVALINDQFQRAESLCEYLDAPVTRWHGEANKSEKKKILAAPRGVLLITPESIEAMFVNHPEHATILFSNLKFIIIDEIHSFIGNDRGLHLKSLVSRIRKIGKAGAARIIGLSATMGDYEEVKRFTGEPERTKVLRDKIPRKISSRFVYWPVTGMKGYPDTFIDDLYEETNNHKVLLFPNSRAKVEELALKLKQTARYKNGHTVYFTHHSSIDKETREHIEDFARNNKRYPFCIVCTSTLELGIDIGSVDLVVQVDATNSISSLIQRTGRSGRHENAQSKLLVFATNPWTLLQAVACRDLYQDGFIEPLYNRSKPFDILFHQVLSELMTAKGMTQKQLVQTIQVNAAFTEFEESDLILLIDHMIKQEYVEDLKRELIVGYKGEELIDDRDFFAMFSSEPMLAVMYSGKSIGTIPYKPGLYPGLEILLTGKGWKITDIDHHAAIVTVVPGTGEGKPIFSGGGGDVHIKVDEKMLELICSDKKIEGLDTDAIDCLEELRQPFKQAAIKDFERERPVVEEDGQLTWYVFAGSKIYDTLAFLLREETYPDRFGIKLTLTMEISELIPLLKKQLKKLPALISELMDDNPKRFYLGKWGNHLPLHLKKQYVLDHEFDIAATAAFIDKLKLVRL